MPRANPSESIEVAARHLFRHLDEPAELRRNPIVAHHFERATGLDALVAVRCAVRQAAEQCDRDDRAAGLNRRAERNAIILEQLCARATPYRVAAKALDLSLAQYYRLKQRFCLRIARVMSRAATRSPQLTDGSIDLASARLEIAERRAGLGEFGGAHSICADLAAHAASALVRIRALCLMAYVEQELGEPARSHSRLAQAWDVLHQRRDEMPAFDARIAECQIGLRAARAAFDEPGSVKGLPILEGALARALPDDLVADAASQAVLVDLLVEGAVQHEAVGDFERAGVLAACAAERAISLPDSFAQKSLVARTMARLQWVAPGVRERPNVASRLDSFHQALELGRRSGSLENVVRSLLNLMAVHVVLGDTQRALSYVQGALKVAADFGSRRLDAIARLEIVDALLGSPRWRLAGAMLPNLHDAFERGSYTWLYCKVLEAIHLARIGRPERSIGVATEAERIARAAGFTRLCGGLQRVIATSADLMGRKMLAQDQIRASIETVHRSGSLLSLGHTYRVAAAITGERRYAERAREIKTELAV